MTRARRVVSFLAVVATGTLLVFGCGMRVLPQASDGDGTEVLGGGGPCRPDGVVRSCRAKLGEEDGIVTCFEGRQECVRGAWSACSGTDVTLSSFDTAGLSYLGPAAGGSMRPLAISSASPDAAVCTGNRCDPGCWGFQEDVVALQADASSFSSVSGDPFGNSPVGFRGKMTCGVSETGTSCASGYPRACNGNPTHYNRFDGCQADHRCDTATGECVRNTVGSVYPAAVCAGVDLTVGPTCNNGTNTGFPICNRGNTALAAGTVIRIAIDNGNKYDFAAADCPGPGAGATLCQKTVPAGGLAPGQCIRRLLGADAPDPACNWGGNVVAFVNADKSIQECGMSAPSPPGTPLDTTKPGCFDNWSDVKVGDSCVNTALYAPKVRTEVYTATCGIGQRPSWTNLTFDASTPCYGTCSPATRSNITFEAFTRPRLPDGTFGPATPTVSVASPPVPQAPVCRLVGPAPSCPVRIGTALGGAAANEELTLVITLNPPAPPNNYVTPVLRSWQVAYTCVDAE